MLAPVRRQRAETRDVLDSLTAEQLRSIHPGSGWSAGQILAHVARSELGEAFFIRQAKSGQVIEMSIPERDSFNADGVAAAGEWDAQQLRAELDESWASLEEAFGELSEADLDLPISWPEWPARTIRDSIAYMASHEAEHVAQVREAVTQPTGSTS